MSISLEQQIINTYYSDYQFFFSKPNVIGIAYGYKIINGIITLEPSIHVYVKKKIALNCLPSNGIIPPLYKNIKTDVIETSEFTAGCSTLNNCNTNEPHHYVKRVRPLEPSYCMSPPYRKPGRRYTGTLGYIVTDNLQVSKTYCLLSINKTFTAFNVHPIGGDIIQPSTDYGGYAPKDTVAKLLRYSPLKLTRLSEPTPPLSEFNTVDGSVASLFPDSIPYLINPFIPPKFIIPSGIDTPKLLQSVQWSGCVTGYHRGTVLSVAALFEIYCHEDFYAWYKDLILVNDADPITTMGDEGALVCGLDNKALGLLSGRESESSNLKTYNLICPIQPILEALKVTLLTRNA